MNDRQSGIDIPAGGTCKWLLKHKSWESWRGSDRGLLWIKGMPGSGKSTLLRYALYELKKSESSSRTLILSHFFHGRGVELQRSRLGLVRSLLYQVLDQVPEALSSLVTTFQERRDNIGKPGEDWDWELDELRNSLEWSTLKC